MRLPFNCVRLSISLLLLHWTSDQSYRKPYPFYRTAASGTTTKRLTMNTYYDIRLTPEQRNALLFAIDFTGGIASHEPEKLSEKDQKHGTPMWEAHKLLEKAEPHPDIDDVYQHEAEHSGFRDGDKVLLECEMLGFGDHVSTVAIHHGTASPSEVIVVSNKLIYHKD